MIAAPLAVTLWHIYIPGIVIVAAFVVFARIVIMINRRVNDHAERIARLEGRGADR